MDKMALFIDDGYLQSILKSFGKLKPDYTDEQPRWKTDYSKLVELMKSKLTKGKEELLRTYYYTCKKDHYNTEEEKTKQERFFHTLNMIPQFECRLGTLKTSCDESGIPRYEQKQVDVQIAVDIVRLSLKQRITKAIIISGDADLIPAIKAAKEEGVVVELFYVQGTAGSELLETVDFATMIDEAWLDQIRMTNKSVSEF